MYLLGVSGSFREASTNTRLLQAAIRVVAMGVDLRLTSRIALLPLFTPDTEASSIQAVDAWISEVRAADGIVVSTPEYAGGYPGALKNAFDWLVATDAYVNKPFMLLNASPRSVIAQASFAKVLETMSGVHIKTASTTIPLLGKCLTASEIAADAEFSETIRNAVRHFADEVKAHIARSTA